MMEFATKEDRAKAFKSALRDSLQAEPITWPPGESWRAGWLLARRIKRLLLEYGYEEAQPEAFRKYAVRLAELNELDPDDTYERFYLAWGKVQCAEGEDPVTQAIALESANGNGSILLGRWPGEVFAADATRLYRVLARLGEKTGGIVFVPCRKFAEALNLDPMRVSRLLAALVENDFLRKEGTSGPNRAQRYRLADFINPGVVVGLPSRVGLNNVNAGTERASDYNPDGSPRI